MKSNHKMNKITKEQAFSLYSECQDNLAENYFPKFDDGKIKEWEHPEITKDNFDFWFSIPNRWVLSMEWSDIDELYFYRYKGLKFEAQIQGHETGYYNHVQVASTVDYLRFNKKKGCVRSVERQINPMQLGNFYNFLSKMNLDNGETVKESDAKVLADFVTPKLPKERIVTYLPLKIGENVHHVHSYLNSIHKEFIS